LPRKAIPEMAYTVSGGTINLTHSLSLTYYEGRMHCKHRNIICDGGE